MKNICNEQPACNNVHKGGRSAYENESEKLDKAVVGRLDHQFAEFKVKKQIKEMFHKRPFARPRKRLSKDERQGYPGGLVFMFEKNIYHSSKMSPTEPRIYVGR